MKRILFIFCLFLITSCGDEPTPQKKKISEKVFSEIPVVNSGLSFNNVIRETAELNYYNYVYLYNGGGVGIGDINNDGLSDVYFTSTMGSDKLFLNKGNLKFEDISSTAGINKFNGHKTGVNFIDINNDGWLDIYVCRSGKTINKSDLKNLLFLNNKDNTFTESASSYGIDDSSHSVQSVFFDADKDGDNDLYISTHPAKFKQPLDEMIEKINNPTISDSDQFYTNEGNGKFVNTTQKSGITNYGYGLGIAAADFNGDDFTDLYISNDFAPHDYYYVNNGDGTFTESLQKYFPHSSYFSMGNDVVDINNDGLIDLFVVEMLSEDNVRQKTNMAPMDMDRFSYMLDNGLYYQYMRNSFHINNGNGHFSDIAHLSGIDKTDWSWGTLFGDYDNDGDKDLLVANGYLNDTQDKDFAKKSNEFAKNFNNQVSYDQIASLLKSTPLTNYAFEYIGDYKFENTSDKWGFNFSGYSNGMSYGDLDNDGDLDVIVNNINDNASLYENNTNSSHYIEIKLQGPKNDKLGLNAKVYLYTDLSEPFQFTEFQTSRGFQSSVEPIIHFGLKPNEKPTKIEIIWNDGNQQIVSNINKSTLNTIAYKKQNENVEFQKEALIIKDISAETNLNYVHKEVIFDDYKKQILIPHKLSQLGPALAKADVNSDGFEDIYIGGAHNQSGEIYLQTTESKFQKIKNAAFQSDKKQEDVDAHFFDADNDGDQDLYVVSGSYEFEANDKNLRDRLYLNDGKGKFVRSNLLPNIMSAGGEVSSADWDNDGDLDLFVGGRVISGLYPESPRSYLLENTSKGFIDVTETKAKDLSLAGMVNASIWTDYNNDQNLDLIVVGEWTDIQFYKNKNGQLTKDEVLSENIGWWNCIQAKDLDNDGDLDYILGNLGQNYKYKASYEEPFEIYAGDFDGNNTHDIVLSYHHNDDHVYPVRGFQCSSEQMPQLKERFDSYEAFGKADVYSVYGESLEGAFNIKANNFNSCVLWNESGKFKIEPLPTEAQFAPIQDVVFLDINKDGYQDIIAAGNWFVSEIETPKADSGTGIVLINNGDQTFRAKAHTGFFANKDVRKLMSLNGAKDQTPLIVVGNNNDAIQVFKFIE